MTDIDDIWKKFREEMQDQVTRMQREMANQTTKDYGTVVMGKFVTTLVQRCDNVQDIDQILADIKKQLYENVRNTNINADLPPEAIEAAQRSVRECIDEAVKSVRRDILKLYTYDESI